MVYGMIVVHVVAAVGMLLALQGWRSRIVPFDLVPHVEGAHAFLVSGRLPDRGCLSGFASYIPPGITWLLLPGMLVFNDPRLFEYLGSGLLYLGTLLGIFLLASDYIGVRCAWLSVGLYGLSELGLHFAGSLWPRGHPAFYVWMIYWTGRWIRSAETKYLTAALITWAAGLYVFMEIAPAVLILPVMWLVHRAPLRLWAVVMAAGVGLGIWYPYLVFQAERGFVDLKSQMLRQQILPAHPQHAWCDPHLTIRTWGGPSHVPDSTPSAEIQASDDTSPRGWTHLLVRAKAVIGGLPYNFERVLRIPDATLGTPLSTVLVLLASSSLALLSMSESSRAIFHRMWRPWLMPFATGMLLSSVLANEFVLTPILGSDGTLGASRIENLRIWQMVLGLGGIALWLPSYAGMNRQSEPSATKARFLALSLLIPWFTLLLLAEPELYPLGGERRFWWLWPLQVILLSAFVTDVLPRLRAPRLFTWVAPASLIVIVLGNSFVLSRMEQWLKTGWSGPDADEIQALDYVAEQLRSQGKSHATIGYQVAMGRFMAEYHVVDPQYKVGADFDLLLKLRHGIVNTNQCAEGISPVDEYRMVQISPLEPGQDYVAVSLENRFQPLQQFGRHQIFTRHDSLAY
ncbi:MAG: hypothetical protein HYZ81_09280 [Nitrospinae bacterium]|nr:hypothetical protein [Nitrospinota bacterium]